MVGKKQSVKKASVKKDEPVPKVLTDVELARLEVFQERSVARQCEDRVLQHKRELIKEKERSLQLALKNLEIERIALNGESDRLKLKLRADKAAYDALVGQVCSRVGLDVEQWDGYNSETGDISVK